MTSKKIDWKRILLFILIATIVSNIFRFDIFNITPILKQLPNWLYIFVAVLLEGSGVILGAFLVIPMLKKERKLEITLFGTSKNKSLLMPIIPIILLGIFGVTNDFEMEDHFYGIVAAFGTFLYCIMEEYGWRGYLQEELKTLQPWTKYAIIGTIWYVWHLSFLKSASIGDNLFFWGMMVLGSWGIGQVAESTKSIMASACFHMIIQIMMLNALIKNGINGTEKIIVLSVSVIIWFTMIKRWEKENQELKQSGSSTL